MTDDDDDLAREYAEAIHRATCPRRSECSVGPGSREIEAARACVAVENRRTAELRAINAELVDAYNARLVRDVQNEAAIARVEALRDDWAAGRAPTAAAELSAALRGSQPTEEGTA